MNKFGDTSCITDLYIGKNTDRHKFLKYLLAHQDIDLIAESLPDISYDKHVDALNCIIQNCVDKHCTQKVSKSERIKNIIDINTTQYDFLKNLKVVHHNTHDYPSERRSFEVDINDDMRRLNMNFKTRSFNIYNRLERNEHTGKYEYIFDIFQSILIYKTVEYMIEMGYTSVFNNVQMITNFDRIVPDIYSDLNINVLDVIGADFKKMSSIFANTFYPFGGELIEPYMKNISVVCEIFTLQEDYMKQFGKNVIHCPFLYYFLSGSNQREYIIGNDKFNSMEIFNKRMYKFYKNRNVSDIIFYTIKALTSLERRLICIDINENE